MRIGALAQLAGTTTRAIRHYHATGLLAEPPRDDSGYRRYGTEHAVRLMRIRRLRDVGMPLDRIVGALGDEDLPTALRLLAADLERQIADLQALHARVVALAADDGLDLSSLPPREQEAAALVDALSPDGLAGVVRRAQQLPELPALAERVRTLPADADEREVEALAQALAAAAPRPAGAPPPVPVETMDALLGDHLSAAQRRCLLRYRELAT